jgi:hypothetical protein
MYLSPFYTYVGASAVVGIITRIWVKFKGDRIARRSMKTPLFDTAKLSSALAPVDGANDDPDILAELHATLTHLNRRAFAEEFWNVDKDLTKYYRKIPARSKPTMARALVRLIDADDKWLQIVGAKTSALLKLVDARESLSTALEKNANDERFQTELKRCLDILRM